MRTIIGLLCHEEGYCQAKVAVLGLLVCGNYRNMGDLLGLDLGLNSIRDQ